MQSQYETLVVELDGPVCVVQINRPKALNALNQQVLTELLRLTSELATSETVRAVVLTGAGEKAFVAGADIAAMAQMMPPEALRFAELGHRLMDSIEALPQPVIAAVNGFALGGGMELAMSCDILLASENARFGQPEVNIGVMPGFGGSQRLPRRVPFGVAAEILLSGDNITAADALRIGLVNRVLPFAELITEAKKLAHKMACRAPVAIAKTKQALHASRQTGLADGNARERQLFSELFATADQKEGMGAFLQKRPPSYTGK
ncbi:MAG TPA: enoyl-CoA hydratase-related protein [Pseudomonadota bacterium]|nr:enoyl-CoA hydratase-related protein [Pseudomonadota bacterium]